MPGSHMIGNHRWMSKAVLSLVAVLLLTGTLVPAEGTRQNVGIIYGTVVESVFKLPLEGAYVMLEGNSTYVLTDKSGDYSIPGVEYGTYELWAYKEGYKPVHTTIVLDVQSLTQDFTLDPEDVQAKAVVTGKVVIEDPAPGSDIADTVVVAKPLNLVGAADIIVDVEGSQGTGTYMFSAIPGNYSLYCYAPLHLTNGYDFTEIEAGVVHYVDFYLASWGVAYGSIDATIIEDPTEQTLWNTSVIAHNKDDGSVREGISDHKGNCRFDRLTPGNYTIAAIKEGYVPVSIDEELLPREQAQVTIAMQTAAAGTGDALLWGFVFGDGTRLDSGWVFTEDLLMSNSKMFGIPGLYILYPFHGEVVKKVTAWAAKHYPDSALVTVPAGGIKRQDFHLKYSGKGGDSSLVFVRVMKEPEMVPLYGASISLYHSNPTTGTSDYHISKDLAATEYTWMVYPVPKGDDYNVKCTHAGFVYTSYMLDGNVHNGPDTFDIATDAPVLLELRMNGSILPPGGNCTIWGYIVLDLLGGFPVIGADVGISPYSGDLVHTGVSGRYEYNVDPGTYYLLPFYPGAYNIAPYDHDYGWWGIGEYPVIVYPGMTRHIDFVLSVRNYTHSAIAGQVLDEATLAPVSGFEVMASSADVTMSYVSTTAGGQFWFSPIYDIDTSWSLIGGYSLYDVVRAEYRTMPSGAWTTSYAWPLTFEVPASTLIYVRIYVDPIGPNDLNSSVIWGYVHKDTPSGELIPGTLVTLWPYEDDYHWSDPHGFYSYEVPYGDYLMQAVHPGMEDMFSLDLLTGTWGIWLWVGTLAPGESRHVDIILTFRATNASTIAGRVINLADGSAVNGYSIKAYTDTVILPAQNTVHGFFTFTPLTTLSAPWSVVGDSSVYTFVTAESTVLPSGATTTTTSYPVVNTISPGLTVWIDIYVNGSIPIEPGTIEGTVLESYSYKPVPDIEVVAIPRMDLGSPYESTRTDTEGKFEFELYPGEYTIQTKGIEVTSPGMSVNIMPGSRSNIILYQPPANMVPGMTTKMKFVEGKSIVDGVEVQIAGIGEFTSDMSGYVSFLLGYRGNYTVTFSQKVEKITKEDGTAVSFNADGTLPLIPGETYTVTLVPAKTITKTRAAELGDPLTIGLLAAAVLALIIGIAVGYALSKGGKGDMDEE